MSSDGWVVTSTRAGSIVSTRSGGRQCLCVEDCTGRRVTHGFVDLPTAIGTLNALTRAARLAGAETADTLASASAPGSAAAVRDQRSAA